MYNLRYHIASLVSVFLALALGLVLGGLIVQKGTFSGQPQALVEGLRKEFTDLRVENKSLTTQNAQLDEYSTAATTDWIAGRLDGKVVAVVTNTGRNDGLSAARTAIQDAGGKAVIVSLQHPSLGLSDKELASVVESLAPDAEEPVESIAASLAAEWSDPKDGHPLTTALEEAGVLSVEGLDEAEPVSGLVDISAPEGKADPAGLALAEAFTALELKAVGAQISGSTSGIATTAADRGVSAIDTLGTEIGRYSLVALLAGADPGYYGTAQRAKALFPPFAAKE